MSSRSLPSRPATRPPEAIAQICSRRTKGTQPAPIERYERTRSEQKEAPTVQSPGECPAESEEAMSNRSRFGRCCKRWSATPPVPKLSSDEDRTRRNSVVEWDGAETPDVRFFQLRGSLRPRVRFVSTCRSPGLRTIKLHNHKSKVLRGQIPAGGRTIAKE